jgi:sugar phosphate isomerase/epimerase
MKQDRRKFIKHTGLATGAGLLWLYGCGQNETPGGVTGERQDSTATAAATSSGMFFKISLAQWSLHRTIRDRKEIDNLDFAATARNKFGIDAVEYVNQFFADKAKDQAYLTEMKKRADDNGVTNVLIMIDNEGGMAETDDKLRQQAVENHYKWVDAAHFLGCHSIRVNAFSSNPDPVAAAAAAADGLGKLATYAQSAGMNIIVENHGGFSSNGQWLSGVMELVGMDNCGTLPDFGNFCIHRDNKDGSPWGGPCVEEYDRYKGVTEMMPFAKGVSAKANDFDENGNCIETDYLRMLKVVKDAGYTGRIGIEYEGDKHSEEEGIRLTKALLERVGAELG